MYTVSKRGCPILLYQGHKFNLESDMDLKKRWRCGKWYIGCRVAISTFDNEIIRIINEHIH